MAGAYCCFCDNRCFVYRINPAAAPVIICETDSDSCTCGAPVSTPAGMHHNHCPTNPASRFSAEEIEAIGRRSDVLLASIGSEDDGQDE